MTDFKDLKFQKDLTNIMSKFGLARDTSYADNMTKEEILAELAENENNFEYYAKNFPEYVHGKDMESVDKFCLATDLGLL